MFFLPAPLALPPPPIIALTMAPSEKSGSPPLPVPNAHTLPKLLVHCLTHGHLTSVQKIPSASKGP